jgi:hypothetical protein
MCYGLSSVAVRLAADPSEGDGSMRTVGAPLQNGGG